DALFEMIDATSCGGAVDSLPHLSLVPLYQRRHGSVYAALSRGRVNTQHLSAACVRHPLAGGQPAFAVDVSVVARCDAETSPGRRVLPPSLAAVRWPADRRGLGILLDRPTWNRALIVDRASRCRPTATWRTPRNGCDPP